MTADRAALVEKVAKVLANYRSNPAITDETAAGVALDLALEEAAKVANFHETKTEEPYKWPGEIAAAIRALKGNNNGP